MKFPLKRIQGSSLGGGIASAIGFLVSLGSLGCLGSCGAACAIPLASLLGVSTAGFLASSTGKALQPVFAAFSAASLTMAYYSLYRPCPGDGARQAGGCASDCHGKTAANRRHAKAIFWACLVASVGVLAYPFVEIARRKARSGESSSACAIGESRAASQGAIPCVTPCGGGALNRASGSKN